MEFSIRFRWRWKLPQSMVTHRKYSRKIKFTKLTESTCRNDNHIEIFFNDHLLNRRSRQLPKNIDEYSFGYVFVWGILCVTIRSVFAWIIESLWTVRLADVSVQREQTMCARFVAMEWLNTHLKNCLVEKFFSSEDNPEFLEGNIQIISELLFNLMNSHFRCDFHWNR